MRPIDADELIRHKRKMSGADFGGEFWDEAVLVFDIEAAPTIDAVEVVRCGECKHQIKKKHIPSRYCEVWQGYVGHGDDGYCAYGERRSEDE